MEHRTSFSLDEITILRLKHLSELWQVSQAEVVRRALERAEAEAKQDTESRIQRLRDYHASGGLAWEKATAYLAEVEEARAEWRSGG